MGTQARSPDGSAAAVWQTQDAAPHPFHFHYVFRCPDRKEPYRLVVEDWELGALFLHERVAKDEAAAVRSVRRKFLNDLCGADKDTRFFVGTRHPLNQWMVIGVFYPPRKRAETPPLFP